MDGLALYDGSGLSRYNYVTASAVVSLSHSRVEDRANARTVRGRASGRGPGRHARPANARHSTRAETCRPRPARSATFAPSRVILSGRTDEKLVFSIIVNHYTAPSGCRRCDRGEGARETCAMTGCRARGLGLRPSSRGERRQVRSSRLRTRSPRGSSTSSSNARCCFSVKKTNAASTGKTPSRATGTALTNACPSPMRAPLARTTRSPKSHLPKVWPNQYSRQHRAGREQQRTSHDDDQRQEIQHQTGLSAKVIQIEPRERHEHEERREEVHELRDEPSPERGATSGTALRYDSASAIGLPSWRTTSSIG